MCSAQDIYSSLQHTTHCTSTIHNLIRSINTSFHNGVIIIRIIINSETRICKLVAPDPSYVHYYYPYKQSLFSL